MYFSSMSIERGKTYLAMKDSIYKAKVDGNWFFLIAIFISVVMLLIGITSKTQTNEYYYGVIAVALLACILFVFASKSSYTLTTDRLVIKFFMYTNDLPYTYIQHVKKSNYPSSGRKAAFAKEGISIYYNQGNILFIAPENRLEFMKDIESRANHIQIIEK